MKFIRKNRLTIIIILIFLAAIALIINIKIQHKYDKNPGLMPPQKDYDVQVELSPEKEMEYETNIIELDKKIQDILQTTGGQEISLGSGLKWTLVKNIPQMERFVEKSRYLTLLGKYNDAIKAINEGFKRYDKDAIGRNQLGNIYQDLKEYKLALQLYKKIVDEYPEYALDILPAMVHLYIMLGDKESAGQNYIQYELSGGVRDDQLMQEIRTLK